MQHDNMVVGWSGFFCLNDSLAFLDGRAETDILVEHHQEASYHYRTQILSWKTRPSAKVPYPIT